ncbi:MAG TPA: two-component regulator propeller domain-containing protein [Steroidobacteraceae bacterium]|nr:two-component regulator propeller domain-containing protein [Steroidobacteraceae bacterium]
MRAFTKLLGWLLATSMLLSARAPATHAAESQIERWSALADTVFQHLARDNDLPNSTAPTALAEDGQGFLWIGTQNGLARWDGYQFRSFKADPAVADALPDNFIRQLHTDTRGRLWVATNSAGLARYDADRDRFVVYPARPGGLSSASLRDIVDDGGGGVWVGTDNGLDHVRADTDAVEHLRHDVADSGTLPDDRIRALFLDRDGVLWVGTAAGVVRRDPDSGRFTPVPLGSTEGRVAVAWTFYQDSAGRVWIGTVRQGVYVFEPQGRDSRRVLDLPRAMLPGEGVHAITEVRPGEIWLGTDGHGIVAVDQTFHTKRIVHDPTVSSSIADDTVQALLTDRSGLVWICTNRGISRYNPRQAAILTVFGGSSRPLGLSDPDVESVLTLPDGRVWLGLGTNGIDVLDPMGLRIAALRPDARHPETALPRDYVNVLARGPSGDVYVGTEQGLYEADPLARSVTRIAVPRQDPTGAVWALHFTQNRLWVGGFDGLWSVDLEPRGRTANAASAVIRIAGLTDPRVTVIEPGPAGSLWIGTKNGLNRLDPASRTLIERILPDPPDAGALRAGYVATVLTDRRGRLWVGTLGGGIGVLDHRGPDGKARFVRLGSRQGLASENVDKLLESSSGQIWASTDDGLAVIDPNTLAVRSLRRAEGVPIANHWAGAGAATAAGELLFGAVGGLIIVRPERLALWSYLPPVVVTDVRIGGKRVPPGNSYRDEDAVPLIVPPQANSIAVEFAALDYSAPERNRYEYRLDGFDPDWIETEPSRRVAAYTNLAPGTYRLRLRGSNRDGVWTNEGLTVPIRVLPAWYQTAGFRILVATLLIGVIAALVQGRTLYLRRARRELERQVVARTADLRESQRRLEQIAYCDTLTALPNRRMFMEEFRELLVLSGLQRGRFALLLIDLDRLKHINDTLGHDVGDALLIEAAIRLQAAVRKSDCVARLGGDEYAVLVTQNPAATDIEAVCKRIVEGFEREILVNGTAVRTSPSIGVAVYPEHGTSQDPLYKSADIALYEAKRSGGNTWCWSRARAGSLSES